MNQLELCEVRDILEIVQFLSHECTNLSINSNSHCYYCDCCHFFFLFMEFVLCKRTWHKGAMEEQCMWDLYLYKTNELELRAIKYQIQSKYCTSFLSECTINVSSYWIIQWHWSERVPWAEILKKMSIVCKTLPVVQLGHTSDSVKSWGRSAQP